nr:MAG TPA: hypothetical protein [Caudoviricetes sp.]
MSAKNIQKLENALDNPSHEVVRILDAIKGTNNMPIIRNTFIVDGRGYSFLAYDLEEWHNRNCDFETLTAGNIMIGRVFGEILDSDFLMQAGKFLNEFDTLSIYIQSHWFDKVSINDIDYKEGRTYFLKLMGDVL